MRDAFVIFPHAADEFELQAMGVRFDSEPKKNDPGFSAFCAIDDDTLDQIEEHDDRFTVMFKSSMQPSLWKWLAKARKNSTLLKAVA